MRMRAIIWRESKNNQEGNQKEATLAPLHLEDIMKTRKKKVVSKK